MTLVGIGIPVPGGPCLSHSSSTGRGETHPLQAPHIPGVRTVSSSWVCPDVVSLLNRTGGDGQGRVDELLAGPTRKVPVTMGTFRGSAVWKEPC